MMARPIAVINVVGLNPSLLTHAPRLAALGPAVRLQPVLPAVTCAVQASMLTGRSVADHGIVANGWYDRDAAEVRFWARSGRLIQAPAVWNIARQRDPAVTCANLFWRYAAYGGADHVVIERPIYRADGRKLPDCYANRPQLRRMLQEKLGPFPLFHFWGPFADIRSSRWIADATRLVHAAHRPTLTLTYLPHLDYPLQKLGPEHPDIPDHVRQIDEVAGNLVDYFRQQGVQPIVLSEYGIEPVDAAIEINRVFREAGLLAIREECGGELLDFGESDAFAVTDHQIAHVYLHPRLQGEAKRRARIEQLARELPGVDAVHRIDHPRAGDFTLEARRGAWFAYDYWLDDARAPDFARTIAIHRKPGYDPRELFCDAGRLKLMRKVLAKKLGLRQLFDVVPLDARLVRGSHGRTDLPDDLQPICLGADADRHGEILPCTAIQQLILDAMFGR